jgi:hypothetical protein
VIRSILRRPGRVLVAMLLWVGNWPDVLSAQTEYRSGDYIVRPTLCWTSVMEFYDPRAYPYFSVDGYFFDANPFQLTRWMENNYAMIMRSTKGWSLVDVTGRYRWTDARIYVNCYVREYMFGLITQPYATVTFEFGVVEPISTACNSEPRDPSGGVYITSVGSAEYDPYDPDQIVSSDCETGGGDGGGGTGGGGLNCWDEYMVIEISYDDGQSWQVWWEGWGRVCQQNEA